MIKLIVSDVDGTILTKEQNEVSGEVLCAIDALKREGKKVAVASGRTYGSLESLFSAVKEDLYFICCDGAVIIHNDKVIYCKQISIGDVIDVIKRPEYENSGILLCTPKIPYVIQGSEDFAITAETQSGEETFYIERLYDIKDPIVKISIWDKNGRAEPAKFLPRSLRVAYNVGEWCEYTSAISNKGLAVSDLQMRLYLTKYDTAAIGDGINDVEMMKKVKLAVSANKACEELKEVCNCHTDNVAEFLLELSGK